VSFKSIYSQSADLRSREHGTWPRSSFHVPRSGPAFREQFSVKIFHKCVVPRSGNVPVPGTGTGTWLLRCRSNSPNLTLGVI
jgi:hypothetical protein